MANPERDYALTSQVAHMYYNLKMSQPEIAKKLFFSRSKISRILDKAEKLGIVCINVKRIMDRVLSLEQDLKRAFGLVDAVVISDFEDSSSAADSLDIVTDFAALHVSSALKAPAVLGISWGTTVSMVVNKIHNVNGSSADVVQLMGATANRNVATESWDLVNKLCAIFFGEGYYLNVPLYVEDNFVKQGLFKDEVVRRTFDKMLQCDTILSGIGEFNTVDPAQFGFGYLKDELFAELVEKGAVGSICAQFYDIDGRRIDCKWNQSLMAMPFKSILDIPSVVVVAIGRRKTRAILGALRGQLVKTLITNASTAIAILEAENNL